MPQNKLVGDKTGQTTQHGRDVYKTSKGENVSEISITFPIGDKWYNAPSIYNGKQYSEDEVIDMVKSGKVKPTSVHDNMKDAVSAAEKRSKEMKYAKGGDTMNQQMRLFQDGGMMDNSGEVVNGTEVPTGSLRNEVADDIPAKLSEGEFVLPADVVRFIGLEKLMKMRDAAKAGLARMEEMGQMGNAQEVANPDQTFAGDNQQDDAKFSSEIDSIMSEIDSEQQFASGGMASVSGENLSGAVKNPMIDVRYFKSDDGRAMYITYYRGKPMTPIPDGFKEVTQEEAMKVGKAADEASVADKVPDSTSTGVGEGPGVGENGDGGGESGPTAQGNAALGLAAAAEALGNIPGISTAVAAFGLNAMSQAIADTAMEGMAAADAAVSQSVADTGMSTVSKGDGTVSTVSNDASIAAQNSANFGGIGFGDIGGVTGSDATGMGGSMGAGSVGDDASGPEGESGDGVSSGETGDGEGGFSGVWAKGGLITKRKQPAKKRTRKGIAAKK